ncbi:MAG: ATP-binding protein [Bacteroidota bacterium]
MKDPIHKNAKILIVDDQRSNIAVLCDLLEFLGYTNFLSTTDSREVVSLYKSFNPVLILLDLIMPHFTGYEVMKQLKKEIPQGIYLPILVLTANISNEARKQALSGGAMDFLVKPFDMTEVGLRINNLLFTRFLHLQLQTKNAALLELIELKSRFVAMASHEFKTPLTSIFLASETLIAYWKRMNDEQILGKLHTIQRQVDHLTGIVNEVLEVSRVQSEKVTFNPSTVDLVTICKSTIIEVQVNTEFKDRIQFVNDFDILEMKLDQRLIVLAISNLLSNATKYSSPGSPLRLELHKNMEEILVSVVDHGMGIPEKDQKHIFESFYRAGNVTNIEGTGLGLHIVTEYIRLHGGHVTFTSSLGQGSTFIIHLPAH